jgi:hypothetical protein
VLYLERFYTAPEIRNSTRLCDIGSDLIMVGDKLFLYRPYGETLRLLWTYDLPVSRPRLPGLLATSDGRRIVVGKELTSRRWLTPKALARMKRR